MPSYRARLFRLVLKYSIGRRLRAGVRSTDAWRELDDVTARMQHPPGGTRVAPVTVHGLPAEWVHGPGAASDAAILYLHGGAFVMGSPATHRELAARISRAARAGVLSLGYRLAPDFPFPAALEDVKTTYRWLLQRGYPPTRVVIGGDSSGGGLALQTLLALREENVPPPCAAFFMSPVTDWVALDGESFTTRAGLDPVVSLEQCRHTAALYVGSRATDPLLRPAEMDLTGLPPLWIHVGDHEVLLSDAERFADRAVRAGVDVDFRAWPGMWHVFQAAARWVPEARQSLDALGSFLRRHVEA